MGLFSSVTSFLGKIADGVVHTIAPGCQWQPSALLQQAESLLPVALNAIPGVGPLLSHAVPAIQAIFSGSSKSETSEHAKVPGVDEIKQLLDKSLLAIAEARSSLEGKLEGLADQMERNHQLQKFDEFVGKITPAIEYYKDSMDDLTAFVPFGGNKSLENYVTYDRDNNLKLSQLHMDMWKAVEELQKYLSNHVPTQDMVDLYVFAVVWLLTYDKTVMQLRGYLAQHYLAQNAMTRYTDAINAWNQDFKEMRIHARKSASFILGDAVNKGFIHRLRLQRLQAISDFQTETYKEGDKDQTRKKFQDTYPKHGIGYTGRGVTPAESGLTRELVTTDDKVMKGLRNGYISVNSSYFDVATRAAVEAAETWRDSLYRWQDRLPLSPPLNSGELVKRTSIVTVEAAKTDKDFKYEIVGEGWKTGETLCYAVSYVTTFGEGFLSGWSESVHIKQENLFVKLTIEPVVFTPNELTNFDAANNPNGVEVEIVRRVYVQVTSRDITSTYLVGDVKGPSNEPLVLWDQAQHHHPKPKTNVLSPAIDPVLPSAEL